MAHVNEVTPVKLFVAVLWSQENYLTDALERLEKIWGEIDFQGSDHPFDITNYYEEEMGKNLKRRIVTLNQLFAPENIGEAKLIANKIEDDLRGASGRCVNLDIGYLDHNKIVLASAKAAGQKIHLGNGIYADFIARYKEGRYQPFEWSFPDFKDGRYDIELKKIRMKYMEQLRSKENIKNVLH